MHPPHHHGHETDLTVRDPTLFVFEVPRGDDVGSTEVAVTAHFTCKVTVESFLILVPGAGTSDTTEVHVGFVPEPGPTVS